MQNPFRYFNSSPEGIVIYARQSNDNDWTGIQRILVFRKLKPLSYDQNRRLGVGPNVTSDPA